MKQSNTSDLGMEVNYVCYAFALQVLAPLLSMAGEAVLLLLLFGVFTVAALSASVKPPTTASVG